MNHTTTRGMPRNTSFINFAPEDNTVVMYKRFSNFFIMDQLNAYVPAKRTTCISCKKHAQYWSQHQLADDRNQPIYDASLNFACVTWPNYRSNKNRHQNENREYYS